MKNNNQQKKEKQESEMILDFLRYLGIKDTPVFEYQLKNLRFDCYLPKNKIAIELKRVFEKEREKSSAIWHKSVNRLKTKIKKKKFKGVYFVNTPFDFQTNTNEKLENVIADELVLAFKKKVKQILVDKIVFKIDKIDDKGKDVAFGASGPVSSFNSSSTIHENLSPFVKKADKQLKSVPKETKKKILLLSNQYFAGKNPDYFVRALSYDYQKLLEYKNIDEIWVQIETQNLEGRKGKILHKLIYTRKFLLSFDKASIGNFKKQEIELFEDWFSSLEKLGDDYKEKLFKIFRFIVKDKKPYQLFKESYKREDFISIFTSWLYKNRKYKDLEWLIIKFIDDPDPTGKEKYWLDVNPDEMIKKGSEVNWITSVPGHLSWTIQKLAVNKNYILKALKYTEQILKRKSLYVKTQGIIPLIEIARRRKWLGNWLERPRRGNYEKFHNLVWDLLKLVEKNPNYKGVAIWLTSVFAYYKDLNTKEVERVLDALKITEESASLFIYFAIFRERHYKTAKRIDFNGEKIKKKLKKIINDEVKSAEGLVRSIIWHFWKLLQDKQHKKEFDNVKEFIDLFFNQTFDPNNCHHLEVIINDWIKDKPKVCLDWYEKFLNNIWNFVKIKRKNEFNIFIHYSKDIIGEIAKIKPDVISDILEKIDKISEKKGVFCDRKAIYEKLGNIKNKGLREELEKKYKHWIN